MIYESHYWKSDLLKIAKRLTNRKTQKKWFETSLAKIEQDVMLGFYIIRKLREAKKLSDTVSGQRLNIKAYPAKGITVTYLNWHKLDELYDFSSANGQTRYLGYLCDQIIHSYVFLADIDEARKLNGILFCSDQKRNTEIYSLSLDQIVKVFEKVGNDYPSRSTWEFNSETNDYDVSNS